MAQMIQITNTINYLGQFNKYKREIKNGQRNIKKTHTKIIVVCFGHFSVSYSIVINSYVQF